MGKNADTIRAFVAAFNAHDPEAIVKCYHPDAAIIYPHRGPQLPAEHAEGERNMFAAVPNYKIDTISLLEAEQEHVLLEIRLEGTQREDLGGRSFNVTGAYIFTMRDGLIQEEHAYPDLQGLRRQLNPK
jgi:ketosteroid isomerase-like protein